MRDRDWSQVYLLLEVFHKTLQLPGLKAINEAAMKELQGVNPDIARPPEPKTSPTSIPSAPVTTTGQGGDSENQSLNTTFTSDIGSTDMLERKI